MLRTTRISRWLWPSLALVSLWLIHVGANIWWLATDTRPPFYDTAGNAITAVRFARLPYLTDPLQAIWTILSVTPYPPLTHLVSVPFTYLSTPDVDTAVLAQTIFLAILFVSVFQIGVELSSVRAGLLSALIVSLYPIIYGLSRHLLLDVPLTAMVAAAVAAMLWSGSFEKPQRAVLAGAVFGLGMLTKWTFAIFVAGPVAVVLVTLVMQRRVRALKNFALAAAVGILVAAPWYFVHLRDLLYYLQTNGRAAILEGDPFIWSLTSWMFYIDMLVGQQILLTAVLLFILGAVLLVYKQRVDFTTCLLFAWIVIPYLAFSFFSNKDIRYTMPYLPAIALVTGIGIAQIRSKWLFWALTLSIIILSAPQFATLTFGSTSVGNQENVSQLIARYTDGLPATMYKETIHIVSRPKNEEWQMAAIVDRIVEDWSESSVSEDSLQVLILPNAPFFEPQGFTYYVRLMDAPMTVVFVTGVAKTDHEAVVNRVDYIVTKTGNLGPIWSLQRAEELSAQIMPGGELAGNYALIDEFALPDGSIARLLRRQ